MSACWHVLIGCPRQLQSRRMPLLAAGRGLWLPRLLPFPLHRHLPGCSRSGLRAVTPRQLKACTPAQIPQHLHPQARQPEGTSTGIWQQQLFLCPSGGAASQHSRSSMKSLTWCFPTAQTHASPLSYPAECSLPLLESVYEVYQQDGTCSSLYLSSWEMSCFIC